MHDCDQTQNTQMSLKSESRIFFVKFKTLTKSLNSLTSVTGGRKPISEIQSFTDIYNKRLSLWVYI